MKKKLLLLLFLSGIEFFVVAQTTKISFGLVKKIITAGNGTESISLLVKGDIDKIKVLTEQHQGTFKYAAGDVSAIILPIQQIIAMSKNPAVLRMESSSNKILLMNDTMRVKNNVEEIHQGLPPLPQSYDGSGIVMGIIDSGIDFSHPDFRDSINGISKTRIKHIWDQNQSTSSNTPLPYGYGQEWDSTQIDNGQAASHDDVVHFGHGTHTAGIAAGNGKATNRNKGVARKSDIIVVALDFDDSSGTSVPDAIHYIYSKAQAMGKPCVINASFGDYFGSHDGKDLEAQLISAMINQQTGRILVAAAGNAGNLKTHLGYQISATDTFFTWIKNSQPYIEVWADTADFKNIRFAIAADRTVPSYAKVAQTPFSDITFNLGNYSNDTLRDNNQNRIGIAYSYRELVGGTYALYYLIEPDSANFYYRFIATGTGKIDAWSFDFVSSNLPDTSTFTDINKYKKPDTLQTIVSGFQCLDNVITVGNYLNKNSYLDFNDTLRITSSLVTGALGTTSSIGPTRDGRTKPDISATGDYVFSCIETSFIPTYTVSLPFVLSQGGYHIRGGGTSAAAPVVAGIAALYLQRFPTATPLVVKNAIISCAKQDSFTGNVPNNSWGYGKINGFATLNNCLSIGMENNDIKQDVIISVYPNPAHTQTTIYYEIPKQKNKLFELWIQDVTGKRIKTTLLKENINNVTISGLNSGIYICSIVSNDNILKSSKMIIY